MNSKFITVEGTEGAGKSTVLGFIQEYLSQLHIDVVMTREPGGTPLAEEIRRILLHPAGAEKISAQTELLLMFAGRSQHINHCIKPALQAGKWVVSDRFIDASYAYQGAGREIDLRVIQYLDNWIVGPLYPDLTLLLDIPADLGLDRTTLRGMGKDRIEQEKIEFFVCVREGYLERAKQDPKRIKLIDASETLAQVQDQVREQLNNFIYS